MKTLLLLLPLITCVFADVPTKKIINVQTGEVTTLPLTAEEIAAEVAAAAAQAADPANLPVITAWQAKAALALTPHGETNLLVIVEAALANMPAGNEKTVLLSKWSNNAQFKATDPAVQSIASQLGLTFAQIKALFELGASLE